MLVGDLVSSLGFRACTFGELACNAHLHPRTYVIARYRLSMNEQTFQT